MISCGKLSFTIDVQYIFFFLRFESKICPNPYHLFLSEGSCFCTDHFLFGSVGIENVQFPSNCYAPFLTAYYNWAGQFY